MKVRSASIASLLAITVCGCGGGESNVIVARTEPDPRFATADGLVEYYNELTTTEPADIRRVSELFYAETGQQEQYIVQHGDFVGVLELHEALYERFGQGYFPEMKSAFTPNGPAAITGRSPQRATATYLGDDGESKTIQLVQVSDRWWLSANMLAEVRAGIPEERLHEVSLVFRGVGAAGREIIPRIERGDFQSFDEARRALWMRAVQLEPELLQTAPGGG